MSREKSAEQLNEFKKAQGVSLNFCLRVGVIRYIDSIYIDLDLGVRCAYFETRDVWIQIDQDINSNVDPDF